MILASSPVTGEGGARAAPAAWDGEGRASQGPALYRSPGTGEGGAHAANAAWEGEGHHVVSRTDLIARAKWMRLHPTEAEKRLWSILRNKRLSAHRFRRQHILFPYIVDFVSLTAKLIVEADGSHHADSRQDARRDDRLKARGFTVLRFWNNDVLGSTDDVAAAIVAALPDPHPPTAARRAPPSPVPGEGWSLAHPLSPTPLPQGERGSSTEPAYA